MVSRGIFAMIRAIDNFLNRITMYRLVSYYLVFLLLIALIMDFTGIQSYDPFALLFSTAFLLVISLITNWIFSKIFKVPSNVESSYITALILALIISPIQSYSDLWFLAWAAMLAMASKYIIAINGKHIFNPAAFAVTLTYFTINQSASWWVGNAQMLPFVLIGGLLLVRRIRRFDLVISFGLATLAITPLASLIDNTSVLSALQGAVLYSPFAFFGFVMLTEPLTAPATHKMRIYYAIIVAFLFTPLVHFGSFYTTPELALLIGNIFAFVVSPRRNLVLKLRERIRLAPDIYEFVFAPSRKLAFQAGQYMEWTLGHDEADSRGNRRYFTLASAPTENVLRLGVKFHENSSSFKKSLLEIDKSHDIVASQVAGDFVLPANHRQKCVFIAGGIGITPFRSMIKYLLDTHQRRPIILFYANHNANEIVYKDIFDRAERELGIKTIYTLTDQHKLPAGWKGQTGRIKPEWIKKAVPGYRTCLFYVSGPMGMIDSVVDTLHELGIRNSHIKTDYFPGIM